MTKKSYSKGNNSKAKQEQKPDIKEPNIPAGANLPQGVPDISKLPKEAQEKLKQIKSKLEKFQKKVVEKFDKYIIGIALLPPPKPKEGEKINKDMISTLVLVDDSDSKKMSKQELRDKLMAIIDNIAKEIDKNILLHFTCIHWIFFIFSFSLIMRF